MKMNKNLCPKMLIGVIYTKINYQIITNLSVAGCAGLGLMVVTPLVVGCGDGGLDAGLGCVGLI